MLKYVGYDIVFREIPDETTLAINISNCPCKCHGCHSSYLAEDIGEPLTITRIEKLINENKGITAICFMGGDNDPKLINHYAGLVRALTTTKIVDSFTIHKEVKFPKVTIPAETEMQWQETVPLNIKIGWYSGRATLAEEIELKNFNYVKLGPYIEECGPLNNPNTNQRLYKVIVEDGEYKLTNITYKFGINSYEQDSLVR